MLRERNFEQIMLIYYWIDLAMLLPFKQILGKCRSFVLFLIDKPSAIDTFTHIYSLQSGLVYQAVFVSFLYTDS